MVSEKYCQLAKGLVELSPRAVGDKLHLMKLPKIKSFALVVLAQQYFFGEALPPFAGAALRRR
jgi:lipase chaperone LimK